MRLIVFFVFISIWNNLSAQAPKVWTSGDVYEAIQKLNFLGSALYVAAHPDDENTRMISYLSNEVKARTAYLSLTRGDGGQNLIGPEIRELLGVIRTHELLAARRIDGGEQLFSRANDFGYSKHSDETLEIWDRDEVLGDVVWAIRQFKPDIIINRFDHKSAGRTHGHHTASAILSYEAFDLSGNKKEYTDQLNLVTPHQARRLFFNTSWWFYGSREAFAEADKSDMLKMDVGTFYPIKGKSNLEIAAESRSQHKCQGMGNTGSRGSQEEYVQLLKGDMPDSKDDPFAGINTTWSRIPGGGHITDMIDDILANFQFQSPSHSVRALVQVKKEIDGLPDHPWKTIKQVEIEKIIQAAAGLYVEVYGREHRIVSGEELEFNLEVTNQGKVPVSLQKIQVKGISYDSIFNREMGHNQRIFYREKATIEKEMKYTAPYWLTKKGSLGMYQVDNQSMIGKPTSDPALQAVVEFEILGESFSITTPIQYKYNSPEDGPVYRPFEVIPPAMVKIKSPVTVYSDQTPQEVTLTVTAGTANLEGTVNLNLPNGWVIDQKHLPVMIKDKGQSQDFTFTVTPPSGQVEAIGTASFTIKNGDSFAFELIEIDYDHIPFQTILVPAEAKFVKLDLHTVGRKIGYVVGAGDDIPNSLSQVGYQVDLIDVGEITHAELANYDAIIMGIRAYNKWPEIRYKQDVLLEYVKDGGTMIVQYNTSRRYYADQLGPYPLTLSRGRVTKEEAPIKILATNHPVMNYPNKITNEDFDNWVQERGLYFPSEWDEKYTPILSSHDPGEDPLDGGLLIAPYGDGHYVYTGYSWFRQLPAGVPGAFRIFANMIALGNTIRP